MLTSSAKRARWQPPDGGDRRSAPSQDDAGWSVESCVIARGCRLKPVGGAVITMWGEPREHLETERVGHGDAQLVVYR
jgi:hypothetical protein